MVCNSVKGLLALAGVMGVAAGLALPSNRATGRTAISMRSQVSYYSESYPLQYVAYKTDSLSPTTLDGDLSKPVWEEVAWTEDFVDISTATIPRLATRAKIRYDDEFLYVAAWLEEPDVWATLKEHDEVIFNDNDFEIFVDPNATTHFYKEFEMNAFNSTWDLTLNKAYGDNGYENSSRVFGDDGWDMQPPLRSAVKIYGPINDPTTPCQGWSVEVALPLEALMYNNTDEGAAKPADGDFWRINFSRVEWNLETNETTGEYVKSPSCQSCPVPGTAAEDNWVWSPQAEIAMHLPERWAILQFSEHEVNTTETVYYSQWPARAAAMAVYYAQHGYASDNGGFTDQLSELLPYSSDYYPLSDAAVVTIELADKTQDGKWAQFAATAHMPTAGNGGADWAATVHEDRLLTVTRK